jgi:hypothetical protein
MVLDLQVESSSELEYDMGFFGVIRMLYQVTKLVDILLNTLVSLKVFGRLEGHPGHLGFMFRTEFGCEVGTKLSPQTVG